VTISTLVVRQYKNEDLAAISKYSLPEEQALYTSLPVHVIEAFEADEYNQPFVICIGDELAGCFALYTDQKGNIYTDNEHAIVLKSLSIDSRHQKKGYALETLMMLPDIVRNHYSDKNEIILTVHETNIPAINLYKKAGFVYKDEDYDGEYGIENIFSITIKKEK
jgi:RimJ/RimL family protein N-acetyltransferase